MREFVTTCTSVIVLKTRTLETKSFPLTGIIVTTYFPSERIDQSYAGIKCHHSYLDSQVASVACPSSQRLVASPQKAQLRNSPREKHLRKHACAGGRQFRTGSRRQTHWITWSVKPNQSSNSTVELRFNARTSEPIMALLSYRWVGLSSPECCRFRFSKSFCNDVGGIYGYF